METRKEMANDVSDDNINVGASDVPWSPVMTGRKERALQYALQMVEAKSKKRNAFITSSDLIQVAMDIEEYLCS